MQASSASASADAETAERLFLFLRGLVMDPGASDHLRVIEEHDLSVTQVRALLVLACSDPEPLPGGQIAERLGISPAAISRALDGLVRLGFLERRESEEDRRVRLLAITTAGHEIADQLTALRRAQLVRIVDELEPQRRAALGEALAALTSRERVLA